MAYNDYSEWFIVSDRLKRITKDQRIDLLKKFKAGDEAARDILIESNIRLVLFEIINKFSSVNYDKRDLVSIGNIGMIKAIDTFDLSKNIEFSTYAAKCIDNEIMCFLRKLKREKNNISLNSVVNVDDCGNEITLEELFYDDINLVDDCLEKEINYKIQEIINQLPDRERTIMIMYFGFFGNKRLNQQELASKFGLSQGYVCRLIKNTVKKISFILQEEKLIELRKETSDSKPKTNKKKTRIKVD